MSNKVFHKIQIVAFIIVPIFFMTSTGWAATYFVDPSGSNTNGNGSQSAPWKSLSYACRKVSAGNTIYVNPGNYTDNSTCSLATGVLILGAGSSLVTINTSANRYIKAVSNLPVINGGNEISGITFNGSGTAIYSEGRSNQKIHDCRFNHFFNAIDIHGKYPVWSDSCISSRASETASYCDDDETLSVEPGTTDWATGVEIYNNQLIDSKIYPHTIKESSIHDNIIDNSMSLKSAVGNTSYWWNNVKFYNNTLKMKTIAWSTIALEVWMVEGDTKFSNNWTNGWFSILDNPHGPNTPYSWEIINNTFASDVPPGLGSDPVGTALETCYHTSNVLIAHNFFSNTGPNNTYNYAIAIWGKSKNMNFMIRNNVIYNMAADGIIIDSDDTSGQKFVANNINIYNNIIEKTNTGNSGILIADGRGAISGVKIKNNIFIKVERGVTIWPADHNVTDVEFTNNNVYGGNNYTYDYGRRGFTKVQNNYNFAPDIKASSSRPIPYYEAKSSAANIIDKGTNVGLPYSGGAPDIGAYEYIDQLGNAPDSVRIEQ